MKNNKLYLLHILECISRIEKYCADDSESFMNSKLLQDAVLRNLQTIGQSSINLSEDIKKDHPEIDWRAINSLRNVLVRNYLGIDMKYIWDVIEQDIPDLKKKTISILASLR